MERVAGGAAAGVTVAALMAPRWWSADVGFADAIAWPGDGTSVVGVTGQADREAARRAIRAALRTALAAAIGVDESRVRLDTVPGQAPHATIDAGNKRRHAWLSISHDGDVSLATFRFDGAIGVDVMRIAPTPDQVDVARDYLGPAAAAALAACPAPQRPRAFARAWSEHEARLKCLGLQLEEWRPEQTARLLPIAVRELEVPDGYVGCLARA